MKKIFSLFAALTLSAGLMATDVTCINLYRYIYTDYATGDPYYSVQFGDEDWNSYYFGFKDAVGPLPGRTYTMDDMIAEQTYASINYEQDPMTTVSFQRNYEGLQEQFTASVTTQSGAQYNLTWAAADIPASVEPVDLDTTIVCDLKVMDNGIYKTFTPLVKDYYYYDFTIAIAGDLPIVNQQKKYTWKANTVYIGNANFQLPGDWNTKPFDATFTINGVEGGYEGIAEYSMTNGKKYTFNFKYTIPVAKDTVYLSGYDLKIQTDWKMMVSFVWQNDTYSAQLPINSTDTLGNWKGNDIILNDCSFQLIATYTNLGVYAIDSIYVTRTEDGYIRLQTSILCKNDTLYVLDVTNQETPYYVKYDTDGTGVKWQNIPAAQYGTGRTMGVRYNNDSIWFNASPTDEGAAGYSIKETYGTYGDPLWEKDSITISYDPTASWGSPLSVYMAKKYYDAELNVNLSSRSYENVDDKGVWNYSFSYGSYQESNNYSFNFGIYCPITAPAQYKTYTLNDMTEDYRTKGYDPDSNEITYDVVTLYRELVWPANDAEKFTINVHTTDGKAYQLIYAADAIPVATDTTEFMPIKAKISQEEYWFQFSGDGVADGSQYRIQIALVGEEVNPTTFYWKQNTFYKPNTSIYNSTTGTYVEIADAWAQVNVLTEEEQNIGYSCNAWIVGYDSICYHAYLQYTVPVAKDTVKVNLTSIIIDEDIDSQTGAHRGWLFQGQDTDTMYIVQVLGQEKVGTFSYADGTLGKNYYNVVPSSGQGRSQFAEGEVTITEDQDGITLVGEFVGEDEKAYVFHWFQKAGVLQYDADAPFDATFAYEDMKSSIVDGVIGIYATNAEGLTIGMELYADPTATTIPEGTYTISDSQEAGTALKSLGVAGGYLTECFAGIRGTSGISVPCWFMVEGTVTLSYDEYGKLKVEVDAKNSYGQDVTALVQYEKLEPKSSVDIANAEFYVYEGFMEQYGLVNFYGGNEDYYFDLYASADTIVGDFADAFDFLDSYIESADGKISILDVYSFNVAGEGKALTLTASFLGSDTIQYNISATGYLGYIQGDAVEGYVGEFAVEEVAIQQVAISEVNYIHIAGTNAAGDQLALVVKGELTDGAIAAGTYTEVMACPGFDAQGQLNPSYVGNNAGVWFIQSGKLTINADGSMKFEGLNSYDKDVTINFIVSAPTALPNVDSKFKIQNSKLIINGQLIIRKGGKHFNALGAEVK